VLNVNFFIIKHTLLRARFHFLSLQKSGEQACVQWLLLSLFQVFLSLINAHIVLRIVYFFSPKDFGTPVAKIDSPRGESIIPRYALRSDQLRKKAASLSLPQTLKIRDDFQRLHKNYA
jgi:hypothetical protein